MINKFLSPTILRYLLVGGSAYLLEMATLYGLKSLRFSDLSAVAISFWIGLIFAFVAQKFITFKDNSKTTSAIGKQLVLYLSLVGFNYVFTLLLVHAISGLVGLYASRTIAIVITTVWNYLFYKKIFRTISS